VGISNDYSRSIREKGGYLTQKQAGDLEETVVVLDNRQRNGQTAYKPEEK
jgi:hypothetical protein